MKKHLTPFLILCMLIANTVFAQLPTISSFSPANGPTGTLVTVNGTNLSGPTAFTIGGAAVIPVSNTGTALVGLVSSALANGAVSVTTPSGTASSSSNFTITPTLYPTTLQTTLHPSDAIGGGSFGIASSLSSDGNTAIVGGYSDDANIGAAYIFVRNTSGVWTQEGPKLVGTGSIGQGSQGCSVSISADGNTAAVGAFADNGSIGAVWIYTRTAGVWSQQGSKLTPSDNAGNSQFGLYVSLSADGNTLLSGGNADDNSNGAAWIFNRTGSTWTQNGAKLVGTGAIGGANQGYSVSLAADGNTAVVGGISDDGPVGAIWIFINTAGVWSQQGTKLTASGTIGAPLLGYRVSLSADGNTAVAGGYSDDSNIGATWVFSRTAGVWTQEAKLIGTGYNGTSLQGAGAVLSADGNTVIVAGQGDSSFYGATWLFKRTAGTWSQIGNKISANSTSLGISADASTFTNGNPGLTSTMVYGPCINPTVPVLSASSFSNCGMENTTLSISSGSLNGAADWQWYEGTCGGTNAGTGTSITVAPAVTTTYYARAVGGCISPDVCTSVTIVVNTPTSGTDVKSGCDTYTWIDGNIYTADNSTATFIIPNVAGCDSLVTLNLTIKNTSTGTDVLTACNSYTWIDGNTYTMDNTTATYTLTNAAGCDSIVTLDLTINTVNAVATYTSPVLTANASGAAYQWIDCNNSNSAISGASNQNYTPSANGSYAVVVTQNTCTDTSACVSVTNVGIETSTMEGISIFPNPAVNVLYIQLPSGLTDATVEVFDINGKKVIAEKIQNTFNQLNISSLGNAMYQVRVSNTTAVLYQSRVVKGN